MGSISSSAINGSGSRERRGIDAIALLIRAAIAQVEDRKPQVPV